jgi:hypothetical protein
MSPWFWPEPKMLSTGKAAQCGLQKLCLCDTAIGAVNEDPAPGFSKVIAELLGNLQSWHVAKQRQDSLLVGRVLFYLPH